MPKLAKFLFSQFPIETIFHFFISTKKMELQSHGVSVVLVTLTYITAALILVSADLNQSSFPCDTTNPQTKSFEFCRTSLPVKERVDDLISRLTLSEKISQLNNTAPEIPRLGIPAYQWWSDALHGVGGLNLYDSSLSEGATGFPQPITSAASFDSQLWYRIGQAIGKEVRAFYNEGITKGLSFWSPNANIFRDPRWGRGQETPGEDPLVVGKYAAEFVRGMQGDNSSEGGIHKHGQHLQASACCKHFTANDLDDWEGINRRAFDAQVTNQDLADTYMPPFKSCVQEGRASGIICADNSVNGVPNCANYNLLTQTAREEWNFKGYITSNCDAVSSIVDGHKYAASLEDAVADVIKAGVDVDCGSYLMNYTKSAMDQKKLVESQVDKALHNLFAVRMRLGLFDGNPNTTQPFGNITLDEVCSDEHLELAMEAALSGIVLLKNSGNLLPLPKQTASLSAIGPDAWGAYNFRGNYDGPRYCEVVGFLDALRGYMPTYWDYACGTMNCTPAYIFQATQTATYAPYTILLMGLDQGLENVDRTDLNLPGEQESLIKAVAEASSNPVVLVLMGGGPVDVSFAINNPKIGSILWVGYPGEAGGRALAKVIFGEHNPGGRLPMTWYTNDFIKVPMTDMRMRPDPSSGYPGRTYRFYNGTKLFEFGYGLSYTTYSYGFNSSTPNTIRLAVNPRSSSASSILVSNISKYLCEKLKFPIFVRVENTGNRAGKHPVLLFMRHGSSGTGSDPIKQLVGFETVSLNAGESAEVKFLLSPCEHFSTTNEYGLTEIKGGYKYLVVEDKEYQFNLVL